MYDLTEKEYERYMRDPIFHGACQAGFNNGFTKEQMLSELCMDLLDDAKKKQDEEIRKTMYSTEIKRFI